MLDVRSLSASYGQHRGLDNASLSVKRKEIVVILGANGAGKSTLLKAISGICEGKVTGEITMQGEEILGQPAHRIVEAGIALVPEGRGIFGDLSVAENLTLGGHPARARDEAESIKNRVLTLFPRLQERKNQIVRTMSGGEQQMVAIGRAMMSNPALLMLDEPSLGLSPLLSNELFQNLRRVRDAGIGILLVEQNARASLAIADRGYLIENGRIVHDGPAEKLRSDPAVQAAYLGGSAQKVSSAPPVTQAARQPRPHSGQSPADIAASALASFGHSPQASAPMPAPPPAALSVPPEPRPAAAPPAPAFSAGAAQPAPAPISPLFGLSLEEVVAEASRQSRASFGKAAAPRPRVAPILMASPTPTSNGDRLQTVLSEIENAAQAARAWRPDQRRH